MKSHVYGLRAVLQSLQRIAFQIADDGITVYAAQASFFVIISAVPFLSLLISILGSLLPAGLPDLFDGSPFPEQMDVLIDTIFLELQNPPSVPLLSLSAVTTLWSASKGIAAIRVGLERVYRASSARAFVRHRLKSLLSTLVFIALITAVVALLLFGDFLSSLFRIGKISELVIRLRTPFFVLFLCVVFGIMYASTARRSSCVRSGFFSHLPGAVFSSVGWILFSSFYSLYIMHFPNASYIYGSLTAICLIMLWLYFCMIILLLGAEINKLYFAGEETQR